MNPLLLIPFLVLTIMQGPRGALVPVYDGRSMSTAPDRLVRVDSREQIFKKEIVSAAKRAWRGKDANCDPGGEKEARIVGIATGSFTRPGSNQEAILYQFCSTAHNFALDGIAIAEADQVIAHFIYEGAWDAAIEALPDVNRNGLSEMVIDTRGTNMGEISAGISIIEVSGQAIRKLGQSETLSDSCGADSPSGSEAHALYAKPGRTPVFYRTAFAKSCKRNAKWRKSENLRVASLEENSINYQRIK